MKRSVICLAAEIAKKQNDIPISIPNAIKRSPTDLLKTINSTVGVDKTAPHFAFIDDPTTIPTTAIQRRTYFLAKELGKRAAKQLAMEWPTLFMFDRDYPRLKAFRPEKPLNPIEVEPTEENLRKMVDGKEVSSAVRLYERLQSENIEISKGLQLDLFHLIAYYNANDVPLSEIEEWPGLRNFYRIGETTWTEAGIADLLFEGIDKNADTYSTMIAALCKYKTDVSFIRAKKLFNEMLDKKLTPNEEAFNYIIAVSSPEDILQILKQMNNLKIQPSVRTFNSYLMTVSKIKRFKEQYGLIRKILGEMKKLNIEPSLTTYSLVLELLCPHPKENEQIPQNQLQIGINVLNEILVKLEMGPHVEAIDSTDQNFFLNALSIAINGNNVDLVDRIEKLYTDRKNTVAMTALTTESIFYSRYLVYKTGIMPLNDLEKLYKELVPRIVGTTKQLTILLADRLSKEQNWKFTRRVVLDSIASRHLIDGRLSSTLRKLLLSQDYNKMTIEEKEEYQMEVTRLVNACIELANFTEPHTKRLQHKLHPQAVAECALLLIKVDQYDRGWELIKLLLDDEAKKGDNAIILDGGFVANTVLNQLFDEALNKGDWYNASNCVQLVSFYQTNINLEPMISKIESKCTLTPLQRRMLKNFVKLRQ